MAIQDISTFHNVSNFIIKKQNLINSFYIWFNFKNENEVLFIIEKEPYVIEPKWFHKNN